MTQVRSHAQCAAAAPKLLQLSLILSAGTRKRRQAFIITNSALVALVKSRLKKGSLQSFIAARTLGPWRRPRRLLHLLLLSSGALLGKVASHVNSMMLHSYGL